jgi:hypothetical protein
MQGVNALRAVQSRVERPDQLAPAELTAETSREFSLVMGTIAFTTIASATFVYLGRKRDGRSYEKVNQVTLVSLVAAVAAFLIFAFLGSPIGQEEPRDLAAWRD